MSQPVAVYSERIGSLLVEEDSLIVIEDVDKIVELLVLLLEPVDEVVAGVFLVSDASTLAVLAVLTIINRHLVKILDYLINSVSCL